MTIYFNSIYYDLTLVMKTNRCCENCAVLHVFCVRDSLIERFDTRLVATVEYLLHFIYRPKLQCYRV